MTPLPRRTSVFAISAVLLAGWMPSSGLAAAAETASTTAETAARTGASAADRPGATAAADVRLVLFLVVDQCRADYLVRYRPLLSGGLARLLDESVWFTEAYHAHAIPKTAPGHASLATGAHPRRHGIISNNWIDPGSGKEVESVEDDQDGVSPRRLLVPTLGDWLKARNPRSQVVTVSGKDRAAVLLGGHRADAAYWFDADEGHMVTSSYYPAEAAAALGDPARWSADRWFGRLWEPVDPRAVAGDLPGVQPVDRGDLDRRFPHSLGDGSLSPEESFYEDFEDGPFLDELTGELAEELLRSRRLGQDGDVDLLAVSLSQVDRIGHHYGPDSPELVDVLIRLDRILGRLLAAVDREVGLEHVVVSLSADHGVPPIPATTRRRGLEAHKLYGEGLACLQRLNAGLVSHFGEAAAFRLGPFFDSARLSAAGLTAAAVERTAQETLGTCPGVARVWTRSELAGGAPPAGLPHAQLWVNAFHPERSPDLLIQLEPYWIAWTSWETTHSSVYEFDRHVPWLLRLPGGSPLAVAAPVATVDVAPTLADLLELPVPVPVDGQSRVPLLLPAQRRTQESP
jgi:predicted AlkP superfamily pyrophosphatase or phosphodiesterase